MLIFIYIFFIIYQKCLKLLSYKLITPLYNKLYQEDACALQQLVECGVTPPTLIDTTKIP